MPPGRLGQAYFNAGNFRRAVELCRIRTSSGWKITCSRPLWRPRVHSSIFSEVTWLQCLATLVTSSRHGRHRRGGREPERAHRPYSVAVAYSLAAMPSLLQRLSRGHLLARALQDLCRERTPPIVLDRHRLLGEAYARSERLGEGSPPCSAGGRALGRPRRHRWYPGTVGALGTAYLLAGAAKRTRFRWCGEDLQFSRRTSNRVSKRPNVAKSSATSRRPCPGRSGGGRRGLLPALALATELGMRPSPPTATSASQALQPYQEQRQSRGRLAARRPMYRRSTSVLLRAADTVRCRR